MIFRGDLLGYLQLNHEHLFRFRGQVGEASASRSLPKKPELFTLELKKQVFENSTTGSSFREGKTV